MSSTHVLVGCATNSVQYYSVSNWPLRADFGGIFAPFSRWWLHVVHRLGQNSSVKIYGVICICSIVLWQYLIVWMQLRGGPRVGVGGLEGKRGGRFGLVGTVRTKLARSQRPKSLACCPGVIFLPLLQSFSYLNLYRVPHVLVWQKKPGGNGVGTGYIERASQGKDPNKHKPRDQEALSEKKLFKYCFRWISRPWPSSPPKKVVDWQWATTVITPHGRVFQSWSESESPSTPACHKSTLNTP